MESIDIGHVSYWASMWSLVAQMKMLDARIEAMKALNTYRTMRGETIAYDLNVDGRVYRVTVGDAMRLTIIDVGRWAVIENIRSMTPRGG